MKVEITILKNKCEHLKDVSYYNNNFYKLPFIVNGCNILCEKFSDDTGFCGNSIGTIVDKKYTPQFFLHSLEKENEFVFNSTAMGKKNEWT